MALRLWPAPASRIGVTRPNPSHKSIITRSFKGIPDIPTPADGRDILYAAVKSQTGERLVSFMEARLSRFRALPRNAARTEGQHPKLLVMQTRHTDLREQLQSLEAQQAALAAQIAAAQALGDTTPVAVDASELVEGLGWGLDHWHWWATEEEFNAALRFVGRCSAVTGGEEAVAAEMGGEESLTLTAQVLLVAGAFGFHELTAAAATHLTALLSDPCTPEEDAARVLQLAAHVPAPRSDVLRAAVISWACADRAGARAAVWQALAYLGFAAPTKGERLLVPRDAPPTTSNTGAGTALASSLPTPTTQPYGPAQLAAISAPALDWLCGLAELCGADVQDAMRWAFMVGFNCAASDYVSRVVGSEVAYEPASYANTMVLDEEVEEALWEHLAACLEAAAADVAAEEQWEEEEQWEGHSSGYGVEKDGADAEVCEEAEEEEEGEEEAHQQLQKGGGASKGITAFSSKGGLNAGAAGAAVASQAGGSSGGITEAGSRAFRLPRMMPAYIITSEEDNIRRNAWGGWEVPLHEAPAREVFLRLAAWLINPGTPGLLDAVRTQNPSSPAATPATTTSAPTRAPTPKPAGSSKGTTGRAGAAAVSGAAPGADLEPWLVTLYDIAHPVNSLHVDTPRTQLFTGLPDPSWAVRVWELLPPDLGHAFVRVLTTRTDTAKWVDTMRE